MPFKHSISIHPHTKKNSPTCHLFFVISINGQRKELPTGISCPTLAYNRTAKAIVAAPGYDTAPIDNLHLQQQLSDLNRLILQLQLSNPDTTLADFLSLYQSTHSPQSSSAQQSPTLLSTLDAFVKNQSVVRSWSYATIKKFRTLRNRFSEFHPNALMSDIDNDFLTSFVYHLQQGYKVTTHNKQTGKDTTQIHYYRNASLAKMLKNIRWFLRWAKNNNHYSGTSEKFQMEFRGGTECLNDIVFLTADELHTLADHQWQHGQQHLERVVDVFLFACYCGLRYSDIASLKRSHIHDDQIHTTLDKTTVKVCIPLNNMTRRILDKYKDYRDTFDHPFPVISDQRINEYIKEAARICHIDSIVNKVWYVGNTRHEEPHKKCDVLSFHCARRTFITQALVLGIPDSVLIQFTGHTTTKMLRTYQGTVDSLKQQQISKFDTL